MDPASLAVSLVALVQVAKTSIDLYEIISDVKSASADLHQMMCLVRLERIRFFLWCDYVGVTNLIAIEATDRTSDTDTDLLAVQTSPALRRVWTLTAIKDALQNIERNFQEAQTLLSTYTTTKEARCVARLKSHANFSSGNARLVELVGPDLMPDVALNNGRTSAQRMGSWNKLSWGFADKRKFEKFVRNLQHYNDALQSILSGFEMVQLRRQNELLATTTSMSTAISQSSTAGSQQQSPTSELERLVRLAAQSSLIDQMQEENGTRASSAIDQTLYILRQHITFSTIAHTDSSSRVMGTYDDQSVLIEWKHYSRRLGPKDFAYVRQRTAMLVLQLQQSSTTDGFSILKCLGHFEDPQLHRVGIVFETPGTGQTPLMTLRDRMLNDRKERLVPDLEARIKLARTIVMTFFRLHSVRWLHKNFRSENVLLGEASSGGSLDLGTPYICGFDFSRQDVPYELTERMPSQLRFHHAAQERSLYQHPDLYSDQDIETIGEQEAELLEQLRYRKSYDVYSLGVVLVEIGLWNPVRSLARETETPPEFHARILSDLLPELSYRMSRRYHGVVEKCLRGEFGDGDVIETSESSSDDHQLQSRRWLESFLADAVGSLDRISF